MADIEQTEYERGVAHGQVIGRLDSHDLHLSKINGSMADVAIELKHLNSQMQHLADTADSDRATVITTASALEKAENARRDKSTSRWSPVERLIGIAFALAALISILVYIIPHVH
jgi:hypothetical protein